MSLRDLAAEADDLTYVAAFASALGLFRTLCILPPLVKNGDVHFPLRSRDLAKSIKNKAQGTRHAPDV